MKLFLVLGSWLLVLALCPARGQQVTISQQPGQVFIANFGASLIKVAVYRALVCPANGQPVTGSWGAVQQLAEGGGINVVDNVLVPATAQRAENKTTLHKWVEYGGYAGLAVASVALFKKAPPWVAQAASGVAGGAALLEQPLSASEKQVQQTITLALGELLDPTAPLSAAPGACAPTKIFVGNYLANFQPIKASLMPAPSAAAISWAPGDFSLRVTD